MSDIRNIRVAHFVNSDGEYSTAATYTDEHGARYATNVPGRFSAQGIVDYVRYCRRNDRNRCRE